MGLIPSVHYYCEPFSEDSAPDLVQCEICTRRFKPETLERHVPICKKTANKPKKVFDMRARRREAIILENDVDNVHEVFSNAANQSEKQPPDRARRNSFFDSRDSPAREKPPTPPKPAPLKRKPANASRGGPPKPKPEPPKVPAPVRRRKVPLTGKAKASQNSERPGSKPTHRTVSDRSTTPSRALSTTRGSSSPDLNGNSRRISSRNSNRGEMRRVVSSPNIETNDNNNNNNNNDINKTKKVDPVVKFKDKFPHHVNPHLEALSAAFSKTSSPHVMISIRKPRTVPGVRTGGHSGVEFMDPDLLKRPQSSIELDSGWDPPRFTEDYVLQHTSKASDSMTDLRSSSDVCPNCNSPFLVSTAKFCFNCGEKRP